ALSINSYSSFPLIIHLHETCIHDGGTYYNNLLKEVCNLSLCGLLKICSGSPSSITTPASINMTRSPTSLAKPISCVTTTMVIPSTASSFITATLHQLVLGQVLKLVHRITLPWGSLLRHVISQLVVFDLLISCRDRLVLYQIALLLLIIHGLFSQLPLLIGLIL